MHWLLSVRADEAVGLRWPQVTSVRVAAVGACSSGRCATTGTASGCEQLLVLYQFGGSFVDLNTDSPFVVEIGTGGD